MKLLVESDRNANGKAAAVAGAQLIRDAIAAKGFANVIVATGASQFEMLGQLIHERVNYAMAYLSTSRGKC